MDTLEMKEVEAAIEGILFASGEPVAVDRICMAMDMDRPTVELVLQKLTDYYAYERRGMRLLKMEDSYQLCSAPEYGDIIRRAFEVRKPAKLSQPALEVLTIIAYYQPTTRAYVDQIRGVDSSYTVGLLLDRHLIEECGRLQVPGRPRLYRTTQAFLRAFHLRSLDDLPEMPGMEGDGQLRLDERAAAIIPGTPAGERDFDTEFLDYILAVKVVDSVDEAIAHILAHSTGHSECIVTEDPVSAERFVNETDSAAAYVNVSTRFTDGGEFGLGCEMGISTQKLHARGPMGLEELCSYKYIIHGDGQIR